MFEEILKAQGLEESKIKTAVAALEGLRFKMVESLEKAQAELVEKVKLADELEEKLYVSETRATELETELSQARGSRPGVDETSEGWWWKWPFWALAVALLLLGGLLSWAVFDHNERDVAEAQVEKLEGELEAKKAELTRALAGKTLEVPELPALDAVPTVVRWGKQFVDGTHPRGIVNIVCGPAAPDVFYSEYPTDTPERYWQLSCGKESRLRQ